MGYYKQRNADRKGRGSGNDGDNAPSLSLDDYSFVRINLTADEKDRYRDGYSPTLETILLDFDEHLGQKHSLKCSYDKRGGGRMVMLTCSDPKSPNLGLMLSARGADLMEALQVLHFKLTVVIEDKPWAQVAAERTVEYDIE